MRRILRELVAIQAEALVARMKCFLFHPGLKISFRSPFQTEALVARMKCFIFHPGLKISFHFAFQAKGLMK